MQDPQGVRQSGVAQGDTTSIEWAAELLDVSVTQACCCALLSTAYVAGPLAQTYNTRGEAKADTTRVCALLRPAECLLNQDTDSKAWMRPPTRGSI